MRFSFGTRARYPGSYPSTSTGLRQHPTCRFLGACGKLTTLNFTGKPFTRNKEVQTGKTIVSEGPPFALHHREGMRGPELAGQRTRDDVTI